MDFDLFDVDPAYKEIKQAEERCKKENKMCSNCGHKRQGSCWFMRCWRGYVDGDKDNWIPETETDIFKEIEKKPAGDYTYTDSDDKYTIGRCKEN